MTELSNIRFRESFISATDGIRLRMRRAELEMPVQAELLITHGMGEHCRRYDHVAAALARIGIRTWLYDLRGHGRSGGRKGDARSYELFLNDLDTIRAEVEGESELPLFLMGHSFGGQITARYLEQDRNEVTGAIIASPWLRLAFEPDRWRIALAKICLWLCPWWAHRTPATPEKLSRDMKHLMGMPEIELMHRRLTPRLFFSVTRAGLRALEEAERIRVPLLLIHGDADTVTCSRATRSLYERVSSSDKTLRVVPDALHETHNDLCREEILEVIGEWITARLPH